MTGGRLVDADTLADEIAADPLIEGVTFLGGEPFSQADTLARIGRRLKARGLSVLTFTGYLLEDLRSAGRQDYEELLAVTDLLIDGEFRKQDVDFSRPWVGSSNQRYHFLTDRYAHLVEELGSIPNRLEVQLKPDGRVLVNGLAPPDDMAALVRGLV